MRWAVTIALLGVLAAEEARGQNCGNYGIPELVGVSVSPETCPESRIQYRWVHWSYRCDSGLLNGGGGVCEFGAACDAPPPPPESCLQTCATAICSTEAVCDGLDNDNNGAVDETCVPGCRQQDSAPNPYASGRPFSTERVDIVVEGPGLPMVWSRRWYSNRPAQASPTYLSRGWRHSYDDRINGDPASAPAVSWDGAIPSAFEFSSDALGYRSYLSTGHPELELRRYASSSPEVRIIRSTDGMVWEFDRFGSHMLLVAQRRPRSAGLADGAVVTVSREIGTGRIVSISDGTGRRIEVTYKEPLSRIEEVRAIASDGVTITQRVVYSYTTPTTGICGDGICSPGESACHFDCPGSGSDSNVCGDGVCDAGDGEVCSTCALDCGLCPDVLAFTTTGDLERATHGISGNEYERYLYETSLHRSLTDIVVSGTIGLSPATSAPVQAGEVVLEHHAIDATTGRAIETETPSSHFGYRYGTLTTQVDLTKPETFGPGWPVLCSTDADCSAGHLCWVSGSPGHCYVAHEIGFDDWQVTTKTAGGGGCVDCGVTSVYGDDDRPTLVTDQNGQQTAYSYDAFGRIECLAEGTDLETISDVCDPPTGARWERHAYSGMDETIARPGLISGGERQVVVTRDVGGRTLTRSLSGYTRNVAGSLSTLRTATTSYTYDPQGRLHTMLKPSGEQVTLTYHTSGADAGLLHQVQRTASGRTLTTTYSSYDGFGRPLSIVDESGVTTTLQTDGRGRVISRTVGGVLAGTYTYNGNGSLRASVDGDGVCLTYEYDSRGFVYAVKRSTNAPSVCGVVPIVLSSGEVELYDRDAYAPSLLWRVTRLKDNVVSQQQEFGYDGAHRRDEEVSPLLPPAARQTTYRDDGLISAIEEATCYTGSANCVSRSFAYDALGRQTQNDSDIGGGVTLRTGWGYSAPSQVLPTTITTGTATATATTTTVEYDDFGNIVTVTSPDSGITRLEYDLSGHVVKIKQGSGTEEERTSEITVDGFGRPTAVAHYLGTTQVSCAGQSLGTPNVDETYEYDVCPSGYTCGNAMGRLTKATANLYCNGSGGVVDRYTVYSYDARGLLASSKVRETTGWHFQTSYTYSPGGRLIGRSSPLNYAYGTTWTLDPATGNPTNVKDSSGNVVVQNAVAEPLGPVKGYDLGYSVGGYAVKRTITRYLDGSVNLTKYSNALYTTLGPTFAYARDASGRVTSRDSQWSATTFLDRFFLYDRASRLICETTTSATTCPAVTDATLRASYTYKNGLGAPDSRHTFAFRNAARSVSAMLTTTLTGGTNRITAVSDGGSLQVNFYPDTRGRRKKDDEGTYTGNHQDARSFTYLPNGRLGTITGRVPWETCSRPGCSRGYYGYTVTLGYDHRGRVFNIAYAQSNVTYKKQTWLYYDEADRLIGAMHYPNDTQTTTYQRWSYFHLGNELVGGVLEDVVSGNVTVTKFWAQTDERGVVYRLASASNGTLWAADQEAFGWRQKQVDWAGKWVPWGMPGQLILEETTVKVFTPSCYTNLASCAQLTLRPPIALNGAREYDPFLGEFLEVEPLTQIAPDLSARQGYVYGANDPVKFSDPTGLLRGFYGCDLSSRLLLMKAARDAAWDIENRQECRGFCSERFRKRWREALVGKGLAWDMYFVFGLEKGVVCDTNFADTATCTASGFQEPVNWVFHVWPRFPCMGAGSNCLKQIVAHEALHRVTDPEMGGMGEEREYLLNPPSGANRHGRKHWDDIYAYVNACVTCDLTPSIFNYLYD